VTFDQIRDAYPHLGLAVYAYEPGGAVTVEVFAADGTRFQLSGLTLDGVLAALFPANAALEPEPSIFD
jgi:hypothetical protein